MHNRLIILLSLYIFFPLMINAQDKVKNELVSNAQKEYGTDNLLVFGKMYFQSHSGVDGHQFLYNPGYVKGNVYTSGKTFENVNLKLDIENQDLVLATDKGGSLEKQILVNPMRIDSFVMYEQSFIHSKKLDYTLPEEGYYSVVGTQYLHAFVLYFKYFRPTKGEKNEVYGAYSGLQKNVYISINNQVLKANKRRTFLNLFPEYKDELKRFMRKNKIRYRKIKHNQFEHLIIYCNELYAK